MNTTYPTQAEAQTAADRIHAYLIAHNADYAASCALYTRSGGRMGTARWAIPYQELDRNGLPVDTLWHITVDLRAATALTPTERTSAGL